MKHKPSAIAPYLSSGSVSYKWTFTGSYSIVRADNWRQLGDKSSIAMPAASVAASADRKI